TRSPARSSAGRSVASRCCYISRGPRLVELMLGGVLRAAPVRLLDQGTTHDRLGLTSPRLVKGGHRGVGCAGCCVAWPPATEIGLINGAGTVMTTGLSGRAHPSDAAAVAAVVTGWASPPPRKASAARGLSTDVCRARRLHHRVLPRCLPEPLGAELRRPLQRLEVDVDQPEPVAEAVHPLEVVLRTPVKVPVHGNAFRGGPLKLSEAGPQEHHPIRVVHLAVVGEDV